MWEKAHTMKRTLPSPQTKPKCYIYWDAETNGLSATSADHLFSMAVLKVDGKTVWKTFYQIEDFVAWLKQITEKYGDTHDCRAYAHNGWGFDWLICFTADEIKNMNKVQRKGRILQGTIVIPAEDDDDKTKTMKLRDSSHLMPTKIYAIGDSLGMPKGITPQEMKDATVFNCGCCKTYTDIEKNHPKKAQLWKEYCERDVKILMAAVENTGKVYDEVNALENEDGKKVIVPLSLPITGASIAYRTWCNLHWPSDWEWEKNVKTHSKKMGEAQAVKIENVVLTDLEGEVRFYDRSERSYFYEEISEKKIEISLAMTKKNNGEDIPIGKLYSKTKWKGKTGWLTTVAKNFLIGTHQVKRAELWIAAESGDVKEAWLRNVKIVGSSERVEIKCGYQGKMEVVKQTVYSVSCDEKANKSAEKGYYGGMVYLNPTHAGKTVQNVKSGDRNAQFPAEMVNHVFPDMNKVFSRPNKKGNVNYMRDRNLGYWGHFTLKPPSKLDIQLNGYDKVWFPVKSGRGALKYVHDDTVSGYYASPLINYALKNGWKIIGYGREADKENKIEADKKLWYSTKMISPFKKYMEHFYDLRLEAQKEGRYADQLIYKICFMNSLYGRFGMKASKRFIEAEEEIKAMVLTETIKNKDEPQMGSYFTFDTIMGERDESWSAGQLTSFDRFWDKWEVKFYVGRNTAYAYFEEKVESELADSCWFGFAAFITANANVSLMKAINACGDNFIYSDTDSVHYINADTFQPKLTWGDGMGQWKPEQKDIIPQAVYWEAKAYTWMDASGKKIGVKHKGVMVEKDAQGNYIGDAGDLTKPQTNKSIRKPRQALRQQKEVGGQIKVIKHSSRYCECVDCQFKKVSTKTKKLIPELKEYMKLREQLVIA